MISEGHLELRIGAPGAAVEAVEICSTRPEGITRVLANRRPEEVLKLASLLFPVCGMAQTVACARAIERAQARPPDALLEAARELVCAAEAATAHLWQLSVAWPKAAGAAFDVDVLRAARQALSRLGLALFERGAVTRARRRPPDRGEVEGAVRTLLELLDRETDPGAVPALFDTVRRADRASFGVSSRETPTLPSVDEDAVAAAVAADPTFARRPEHRGAPVDASAYARAARDPDVQAIERTHGRGLLARLAARRAEARAARARLAALSAEPVAPRRPVPGAMPPATGAAAIDTARGPLVCWVSVVGAGDDARVTSVRTVAPTDWTFHPEGVVPRSLVGAPATSTLARDVGWFMLALDPCVGWRLTLNGAPAGGDGPDA